MNFDNAAIVPVGINNYRIHFQSMTTWEAVNRMKNTNASEKTAQVKLRKNVVSLMSSNTPKIINKQERKRGKKKKKREKKRQKRKNIEKVRKIPGQYSEYNKENL